MTLGFILYFISFCKLLSYHTIGNYLDQKKRHHYTWHCDFLYLQKYIFFISLQKLLWSKINYDKQLYAHVEVMVLSLYTIYLTIAILLFLSWNRASKHHQNFFYKYNNNIITLNDLNYLSHLQRQTFEIWFKLLYERISHLV
jgi:hypothetical protein